MKQSFCTLQDSFRSRSSSGYMRASNRSEASTCNGLLGAVSKEGENGLRRLGDNFRVCMKPIHNSQQHVDKELHAAINIFYPLTTDLQGEARHRSM